MNPDSESFVAVGPTVLLKRSVSSDKDDNLRNVLVMFEEKLNF